MYDPIAIANYFIELSQKEEKPITHMKLQKLVYIANGFYLALYNKPLINEMVEAWKYGPVINSVYEAFKLYGSNPITDYGTRLTFDRDSRTFSNIAPILEEDSSIKELLDEVWNSYKGFTAERLSNLTHMNDTPWYKTVLKYVEKGIPLPKHADIDFDLIEEYYKKKLSSVAN